MRQTEPKETATQQLLISTAADNALEKAHFEVLRNLKVYLQTSYLDCYDQPYVIGTIRDVLSSHGALLVDTPQKADVIVEARSGALSIDSSQSLVGVPKLPVPIPFSGTVVTPEIPFFKSQKENSVAKLALFAYGKNSRRHLFSTGPLEGKAYSHFFVLLGYIKFRTTDIPEQRGIRPSGFERR